jgi:hypothetical protein
MCIYWQAWATLSTTLDIILFSKKCNLGLARLFARVVQRYTPPHIHDAAKVVQDSPAVP